MPELPEVETVVRRLAKILPGKVIKKVKVFRAKSFQGQSSKLKGATIKSVFRRAKLICLQLDDDFNLLIHLKMTGQLIFIDSTKKTGGGHPTSDWINELPSKHTRVKITFQDNSILYFNDMRVFGWMRILNQQELAAEFKRYGPDANSEQANLNYLKKTFAHRSIPIKQAIMNNRFLAGIGNIYANEALFHAGVHPRRPAKSLTDSEWKKLYNAIRAVLSEGIKAGGTTFDGRYVDVDGLAGRYQVKLAVYGQAGKPCQNCRATIKKIKLGSRGTYFCPHCQI